MRKLLIVAGIIAAVVIAGIAAALMLIDVNQFRGSIQAQMEQRLHRTVAVGNMTLGLFPLSIRIQDFSIGEAPEYASAKPFVSAREVRVSAGLLALLQKRIEVTSLRLVEPFVELIKNRAGGWNFSSLGSSAQSAPPQQSPAISLERLEIQNGTIAYTNHQTGQPRSVYDRIDLTLKNYAPGQRFSTDLRAHLPGKGKQEVALTAGGTAGITDLDGTLSLTEVSAGPALLSGGGQLSTHGDVITGKGLIKASEVRLRQPLEIRYELLYDRPTGKLTITPLTATLGALRISGRADVETAASPLPIHAALRTENAPLTELLKVANAFGVAEGFSGTGSLSADIHVDGKASSLSYSGTATIGSASISTSPSAKPIQIESATAKLNSSAPPSGTFEAGKITQQSFVLTQVRSNYRLDAGILHLDPISASVFGGHLDGSVAVDTRTAQSNITTKAKLEQLDAAQLLAATSSVKNISGVLSGNADLKLATPPGQDPRAA
jgi:uncharacterized protein involved in outer membrane biogenesis